MATLERFSGSVLLGALLLSLVLFPFVDAPLLGVRIARLVMMLVLLSALGTVGRSPLGIALVATALASDLFDEVFPTRASLLVSYALRALSLAFVGFVVLWRTLTTERVTFHTIAGGASVYLLIGFIWAQFFALVELIEPGSFGVPPHWLSGDSYGSARFVYFSFVTLATLGYGDIVPVRPAAASLTLLEAVLGQLYVAILIARLVGLHAHSARNG